MTLRCGHADDPQLLQLAEIAQSDDYRALADWVLQHAVGPGLSNAEAELSVLVDRFGHLQAEHRERSWATSSVYAFSELQGPEEQMGSAATECCRLADAHGHAREAIERALRARRYGRAARLLRSLAPVDLAHQRLVDLRDRDFLLEELIRILEREFDKRVVSIRSAFDRYMIPHHTTMKRLASDLAEVESGLRNVSTDDVLTAKDRHRLARAFTRRREALLAVRRREVARMRSVRQYSGVMKDGVERFRNLVDGLRSKRRSLRKRDAYVAQLARLGSDTPELSTTLEQLYNEFRQDVGPLRDGLSVMDAGTHHKVLQVIDHQEVVNRIVFAAGKRAQVELEIGRDAPPSAVEPATGTEPVAGPPVVDPRPARTRSRTRAEALDLSYLAPIGRSGS